MIQNSFIFLEKITAAKEKKLWQQGILSWDDFLRAKKIQGISAAAKKYYDRRIIEARKQLYLENSGYFASLMPQAEHWRLYDFFREDAVYLDIETDGLSDNCDVTVVGFLTATTRKQ